MNKATQRIFLLCTLSLTIYACEISSPTPDLPADTLAVTTAYTEPDPVPQTVADHVAVESNQALATDTGIAIKTGNTSPDELMRFAESLIGIPYVYGSTDPKVGFDCSGFITYVFTHFNISVPRSSIDFLNVGKTVRIEEARRGDFILFTGTNEMETDIGHMGLVVSNNASGVSFIHATSGRAMSVTITPLNEQYKKRFVRISRIFS